MAALDTSNVGIWDANGKKFADPFILPSNESIPLEFETALDFSLYLYHLIPQYRRATQRVVSHFITDVDFDGEDGDQKERDSFYDYLKDHLDIFGALLSMGEEWGCYGNSFWRIHFPFDRWLIDNRNGDFKRYSLDMFGEDAKYLPNTLQYEVPDPTKQNGRKGAVPKVRLPFHDQRSTDISRIALRKIDPRRVHLRHSLMSGKTEIVYRFEEWFVRHIKDGYLWQVNDTPIAMLRAIRNNEDFLFNPDEVFHFKAPTVSGLSHAGWGIAETIYNYRSMHQVMVYRRIDEAVGLDYMLPFRIFTPNLGDKAGDASLRAILPHWSHFIEQMVKRRRIDPYAMHALPFPVNFQEFAGADKELVPMETMQFHVNDMLDSMGYPAELFRGSLKVDQMPPAVRIFENNFHFIYQGFDAFLRWVSRRIQDYLTMERMGVSLELPRLADDLEKQQVYLQLAAGGEISRETAYRPMGIDNPVQEAKQRMQEDIEIQRAQMKEQDNFQREQQMGTEDQMLESQQSEGSAAGAPAPDTGGTGAAGAAPGGSQLTPLDMADKAQSEAQNLLAIPDNGQRAKAMEQLEASDPNLYAVVKEKMEEARSQGASAGRKQVGQQAQQAQQQQGG